MARCVRWYWDQEDLWFFLEVDDDGWVTRQVELQGPDATATAAISRIEWEYENGRGGLDRYRKRYGGGLVTDPFSEHELAKSDTVPSEEFEETWRRARAALDK